MNGTDLLAEFRKTRAEGAFSELVRRYTDLVYSVAKRRLANASQAEDVTQTVFIRLAKSIPSLRGDAELVAWLHRTTVHASIDLWRSEARRRTREQHVAAMQLEPAENATWTEIAPLLDEALNELNDAERQIILLRFFEQRTMRDLGLLLGISEDAAKMRVSRAMEHLRAVFSQRGAVCGSLVLAGLLTEHAVEAAPARLVLTLASLRFPVAVGLGAGGLAALLAQLSKAKLAAGLTAALAIGTATVIWRASATRTGQTRPASAGQAASNPASAEAGAGPGSTGADAETSALAADTAPDPLKLLQGVARARNRVTSGEVEFDVERYEFSRPFDGTNRVQLKVRFDGSRRRFESFGREYAVTAVGPEAGDAINARIEAEGLDRESAVRAGLLNPFASHRVAAYDGSLLLEYWESDGRPEQAKVDDAAKGSITYLFDPRCLGLDSSPGVLDTVESCLACGKESSVQLLGSEFMEGLSAWHVRVRRGSMDADLWLQATHPFRVLRYTFNGSEVISRYDESNPRDSIPLEVTEMLLHGTTGAQTAFTATRIMRRNARFNVPIDPTSWTLAGLGMKVGTDVIDYRISRRIGYWTGGGLSDDLPRRTAEPQTPPVRSEMLAVLVNWPSSPEALNAAEWVLLNTPDGPEVDQAAEVLLQAHIADTNLVPLCQQLERMRHRCSRKLLEAMLQKNPSADVRGNACFALATLRMSEARYGQNQQATADAKQLFERVMKEFGRVKRNGTALADLARPEFFDLHRLTIGKTAPEIEGTDLNGQSVKLSDYRGQVVLLIFWGKCGGCRPDVSVVLKLLDRLKGKPFAVLGVYCDDDLTKAKAIVSDLGMIWPSLRDGRTGPISTAWNNQMWPAFDLVDANGIIRYRNVSELELPRALGELISN
jgi:RNA polymerase sigma factor (sigma-70 family)